MSSPIPLLMVLELLRHHDDDRMEHELRVGVVGVKEPLTAEIESDFYRDPRVNELWGGGLDLLGSLQDALLVKCFGRLRHNPDDTDIREVFLPDATGWIESEFPKAEALTLLTALRRHVTPGLVQPSDICTSMAPVRLVCQGGRQ